MSEGMRDGVFIFVMLAMFVMFLVFAGYSLWLDVEREAQRMNRVQVQQTCPNPCLKHLHKECCEK